MRVTDDVIEYRAWIEKTFPVLNNEITENDSLSSLSSCSSERSESPDNVTDSVSKIGI